MKNTTHVGGNAVQILVDKNSFIVKYDSDFWLGTTDIAIQAISKNLQQLTKMSSFDLIPNHCQTRTSFCKILLSYYSAMRIYVRPISSNSITPSFPLLSCPVLSSPLLSSLPLSYPILSFHLLFSLLLASSLPCALSNSLVQNASIFFLLMLLGGGFVSGVYYVKRGKSKKRYGFSVLLYMGELWSTVIAIVLCVATSHLIHSRFETLLYAVFDQLPSGIVNLPGLRLRQASSLALLLAIYLFGYCRYISQENAAHLQMTLHKACNHRFYSPKEESEEEEEEIEERRGGERRGERRGKERRGEKRGEEEFDRGKNQDDSYDRRERERSRRKENRRREERKVVALREHQRVTVEKREDCKRCSHHKTLPAEEEFWSRETLTMRIFDAQSNSIFPMIDMSGDRKKTRPHQTRDETSVLRKPSNSGAIRRRHKEEKNQRLRFQEREDEENFEDSEGDGESDPEIAEETVEKVRLLLYRLFAPSQQKFMGWISPIKKILFLLPIKIYVSFLMLLSFGVSVSVLLHYFSSPEEHSRSQSLAKAVLSPDEGEIIGAFPLHLETFWSQLGRTVAVSFYYLCIGTLAYFARERATMCKILLFALLASRLLVVGKIIISASYPFEFFTEVAHYVPLLGVWSFGRYLDAVSIFETRLGRTILVHQKLKYLMAIIWHQKKFNSNKEYNYQEILMQLLSPLSPPLPPPSSPSSSLSPSLTAEIDQRKRLFSVFDELYHPFSEFCTLLKKKEKKRLRKERRDKRKHQSGSPEEDDSQVESGEDSDSSTLSILPGLEDSKENGREKHKLGGEFRFEGEKGEEREERREVFHDTFSIFPLVAHEMKHELEDKINAEKDKRRRIIALAEFKALEHLEETHFVVRRVLKAAERSGNFLVRLLVKEYALERNLVEYQWSQVDWHYFRLCRGLCVSHVVEYVEGLIKEEGESV